MQFGNHPSTLKKLAEKTNELDKIMARSSMARKLKISIRMEMYSRFIRIQLINSRLCEPFFICFDSSVMYLLLEGLHRWRNFRNFVKSIKPPPPSLSAGFQDQSGTLFARHIDLQKR